MKTNLDERSAAVRIRRRRRGMFLTQKELAARCGVTQSAVAKWENGDALPALSLRPRVAEALDFPAEFLFPEDAA